MKKYKSTIKEYKLKSIPTDIKKAKLATSQDSYEYIKPFFFEDMEIFESCFMILLNRANNTIGYVKISQGGLSSTIIDKLLVAKYAVESLASAVIIAHNHPSGNLNPSESDKRITREVKKALETFNVQLLDHLILTSESYTSLADEGLI